jgi:hypothetical protein
MHLCKGRPLVVWDKHMRRVVFTKFYMYVFMIPRSVEYRSHFPNTGIPLDTEELNVNLKMFKDNKETLDI